MEFEAAASPIDSQLFEGFICEPNEAIQTSGCPVPFSENEEFLLKIT